MKVRRTYLIMLLCSIVVVITFTIIRTLNYTPLIVFNDTNRYGNYGNQTLFCNSEIYYYDNANGIVGLYKMTSGNSELITETDSSILSMTCDDNTIVFITQNSNLHIYSIDSNTSTQTYLEILEKGLRTSILFDEADVLIFTNDVEQNGYFRYSLSSLELRFIEYTYDYSYDYLSLHYTESNNFIFLSVQQGSNNYESIYSINHNREVYSTIDKLSKNPLFQIVENSEEYLVFSYASENFLLSKSTNTLNPSNQELSLSYYGGVTPIIVNHGDFTSVHLVTFKDHSLSIENERIKYYYATDDDITFVNNIENSVIIYYTNEFVYQLAIDGLYKSSIANPQENILVEKLEIDFDCYVEVKGNYIFLYKFEGSLLGESNKELIQTIDIND